LGIITQQAIRRGTFASARNLIDALGALTDGWQDSYEPSGQPGTGKAIASKGHRQNTSNTQDDLRKRSSRSVENSDRRAAERPADRIRDSKSVRAEFHGTRGRRSGPTNGIDG
ncbi:MAG: hypothetical protein ACRDTJ_27190, partial [Pseudonocardiaceae bacterium]